MIDSLYARYSRLKDKPPDPNYKPQDSIRGKIIVNENADQLAVIFPGWHTHEFPVNHLAKRLAKKGWSVLVYDFHDQILEPSDEVVEKSFEYIRDHIKNDLTSLTQKHRYRTIHFIGISLGNVAMALVAERFKNFDSATIVVGGEDLAVDMWHGLRTLYLRDEFKKAHVGLRKLDKDWNEESPSAHARRFSGKRVKFVLSGTDKFILPKYQKKFLADLQAAGAQVILKTRFTGHLFTIVRYCFLDSPL